MNNRAGHITYCMMVWLVSWTAFGQSSASLPIITPNGIMTLSGTTQVLFKVVDPTGKSGEQSYMLGQGEGRGGIKIVSIDQPTATIIFDNHGTIQKIAIHEVALVGMASPPPLPAPVPVAVKPAIPAESQPVREDDANNNVNIINLGGQSSSQPAFRHIAGLSVPPGGFNPAPGVLPPNAIADNSTPTTPAPAATTPGPLGAEMNAAVSRPGMPGGPAIAVPAPPQDNFLLNRRDEFHESQI